MQRRAFVTQVSLLGAGLLTGCNGEQKSPSESGAIQKPTAHPAPHSVSPAPPRVWSIPDDPLTPIARECHGTDRAHILDYEIIQSYTHDKQATCQYIKDYLLKTCEADPKDKTTAGFLKELSAHAAPSASRWDAVYTAAYTVTDIHGRVHKVAVIGTDASLEHVAVILLGVDAFPFGEKEFPGVTAQLRAFSKYHEIGHTLDPKIKDYGFQEDPRVQMRNGSYSEGLADAFASLMLRREKGDAAKPILQLWHDMRTVHSYLGMNVNILREDGHVYSGSGEYLTLPVLQAAMRYADEHDLTGLSSCEIRDVAISIAREKSYDLEGIEDRVRRLGSARMQQILVQKGVLSEKEVRPGPLSKDRYTAIISKHFDVVHNRALMNESTTPTTLGDVDHALRLQLIPRSDPMHKQLRDALDRLTLRKPALYTQAVFGEIGRPGVQAFGQRGY